VTESVQSFASFSATTIKAYDSSGRLYCTISPLAYSEGTTSCPSAKPSTYTPPHNPASDPFLGASATVYDLDGRPIYQINPLGGVTETAYDQAGETWCAVSAYDYSNAGGGYACPSSPPSSPPTQGSDPDPGMTITSFNSAGQAIQSTNALGGITITTYDPAGNVLSTTVESATASDPGDPNVVTAYTYDGDNQKLDTTVGSGSSAATSTQAYDPNGNVFCALSAKEYSSGSCPAWSSGWVAPPSPSSLSSLGFTDATASFSDPDGDALQSTDPDGHTTLTAFDADDRTYCTVDPTNFAGSTTCPTTPPTSPPSSGSDPGYTTTIYDKAGHTVDSTDQLGDTTAYAFDGAGQQISVTDPDGNVTTSCFYAENATGQCANAALATGGLADDLYQQVQPSPGGSTPGVTTTYTYGPGTASAGAPSGTGGSSSGDLQATVATPGAKTSNSYDANGDLSQSEFASNSGYVEQSLPTQYSYFVDGTREQMTDGLGTTNYTEDALGDVTKEAFTPWGGTSLSSEKVTDTYYSNGDLKTETYPAYGSYTGSDLPTATYTYNNQGEMASVSDWLTNGSGTPNTTTFSFDGDGNLTSQTATASGGATPSTSFAYDAADLNTSATSTYGQSCAPSTPVTLTQSFSGSSGSRNPDGLVTEDSESTANADCSNSISYARYYDYNQASQLTYQGSSSSSSANFAYDHAGNPQEVTDATSSGTFQSYNQVFNTANQLTTQKIGSTPTTSYTYDGLGDQTTSTTSGATTTYGYDGIGQMAAQENPSGSATGYLYTGDGLEAATIDMSSADWDQKTIDGSRTETGVSCPWGDQVHCAVVDSSGYAVVKTSTWGTPSLIDSGHALTGVFCLSADDCDAIDNAGNVLTYNGSTWPKTDIDSTRSLTGISCGLFLESTCVAVDGSGYAVVWTYSSGWGPPASIDTHALNSVSCNVEDCFAVDNDGNVLTYNGSTWTTSTDVDGTHDLTSVSCDVDSSNFCVAVDNSGDFTTETTASTWTTPAAVESGSSVDLTALSCASVSFCMGGDSSGNTYTFDGTEWAAPESTFSPNGVTGASCPLQAWCVALTSNAKGQIFSPPTSQMLWTPTSGSALPVTLTDSSNDYVYGPSGEPVEAVQLGAPTSTAPLFMTYTSSSDAMLVTNSSGDLVGYTRYDAIGNPINDAGAGLSAAATPFGYAGQFTDANSGLVNMRARWYQPGAAEFTTVDPAFSSTDQAYSYAGDDPVNNADASGLQCTYVGNLATDEESYCDGGFACAYTWYDPQGVGTNTACMDVLSGTTKVFGTVYFPYGANLRGYGEYITQGDGYQHDWAACPRRCAGSGGTTVFSKNIKTQSDNSTTFWEIQVEEDVQREGWVVLETKQFYVVTSGWPT